MRGLAFSSALMGLVTFYVLGLHAVIPIFNGETMQVQGDAARSVTVLVGVNTRNLVISAVGALTAGMLLGPVLHEIGCIAWDWIMAQMKEPIRG